MIECRKTTPDSSGKQRSINHSSVLWRKTRLPREGTLLCPHSPNLYPSILYSLGMIALNGSIYVFEISPARVHHMSKREEIYL